MPNTKNFKSPDELFLGQKPSIKKLKPFGSKVFYKVNSKKDLKKLEHRAREAIYLNFDQNTQCYKLIDVMDWKLIKSREIELVGIKGESIPKSKPEPEPIVVQDSGSYSEELSSYSSSSSHSEHDEDISHGDV